MISCIICSVNKVKASALVANIAETIGIPHEVIVMENYNQRFGICEAYNTGAAKSHFDLLCFLHEDITFKTMDWGKIVVNELNNPHTGVLGIAGGQVKTKSPSSWWYPNPFEYTSRFTILQNKKGIFTQDHYNPEQNITSEVIVLDGVWLACSKSTWVKTKFDANTFPDFHFYDLDFSLSVFVNLQKTNKVTHGILLEHASEGNYNRKWFKYAVAFSKKWKKKLPVFVGNYPEKEITKIEEQARINFLWQIIQYNLPFIMFLQNLSTILFKPKYWVSLLKMLLAKSKQITRHAFAK